MKKSWIEKFLGIELLSATCMLITYAICKLSSLNVQRSAMIAALTVTILSVGLIMTGLMIKSTIVSIVSIINIATACACWTAAFVVSKIAFYVVTSLVLFIIMSTIAATTFAQKTGTKRRSVFASLGLQMLGTVFAMLGSWMWASLDLGALLFLFILVRRNPYYFGDPDLMYRK
jgi:hypothetical protein